MKKKYKSYGINVEYVSELEYRIKELIKATKPFVNIKDGGSIDKTNSNIIYFHKLEDAIERTEEVIKNG